MFPGRVGVLNGRVERQRLVKGCDKGVKSVKICFNMPEKECFGHVGGWGGLGGFMV